MKYLPLRDFEDVTSALNFDTPECHIIGGCDLYTTKAAGSDKKLYKDVEASLKSQYESLDAIEKQLPPGEAGELAQSLDFARSTPFGPLSEPSSRRTFAYLIATLNASHPDYDFSHVLRPSDFRRERNLRSVMNTIDNTLYNLRPRPSAALLAVPQSWPVSGRMPMGIQTPGGSLAWSPRMWSLIDNEMGLRDCSVYCYAPEEDPFDGEEGAIWSMNYFFFNKELKRVCYLYIRGLSVLSHSPVHSSAVMKRKSATYCSLSVNMGAKKRARYWLGDEADLEDVSGGWAEDDEDMVIEDPGDDEVDADPISDVRDETPLIYISDSETQSEEESDSEILETRERQKSAVRRMSEHIADAMEV